MSQTSFSSGTYLAHVDVSPDMAGLIHTLFVMRAGEGRIDSVMPAYSAQLFSFVEGSGAIHFPERPAGYSSDITLNAPMLRAAPMVLEGPVLNIGASFTPLGWAMFSGLAADKVHDCAFAAYTVIPEDQLAPVIGALDRVREGALSPEAYCRVIEEAIRQICATAKKRPRADHLELLAAIDDWLGGEFNPPVQALYDAVDLGQRQVQRLCRRYFGVPPAQLVKRFRAIRAAMLLAHDDLSEELRDEVVGSYFDQAHLIHDIRRYTGHTPRGLSKEPFAQNILDPDGHGKSGRNLRKT